MGFQILSPLDQSYKITSWFNSIINYGPEKGRTHHAIDYSAPKGTPIYAVADGIVSRADSRDPAGGNIIELTSQQGNDKLQAVYAHLDKMYVKPGQSVRAGQIIGQTGATGQVSGAHLHFELKLNGAALDPQKYINGIVNPKDISATLASLPTIIPKLDHIDPETGTPCPIGYQFVNGHCQLTSSLTQPEDIPILGQAIALGEFLGTLVNPANWAKILAIVGGAGMIVWGGIIVWQAS